jgi:hypothetical protein
MQPLLLLPYCYRLQDLKPSDMQGLVVILFGLLLYRFCAPLVALLKRLHRHWSGEGPDVEEEEAGKKLQIAERKVTRHSVKFVGLNQVRFTPPLLLQLLRYLRLACTQCLWC